MELKAGAGGFMVSFSGMSAPSPAEFTALYRGFPAPIAAFDCGQKCSPHNEGGAPFCCDTRHAVPTAYTAEWAHLQANTDLWHRWQAVDPQETARLEAETPPGQVLIECLGHRRCQRDFRALTCRAFPFFPYLDSTGCLLGLTYYWEYQDRCWVISHLEVVTPEYRRQFLATYDALLERLPGERETFAHHSAEMRRVFARRRRLVPLLHRDGQVYHIQPGSERLRLVRVEDLPRYGPYRVAARLPFPDELPPANASQQTSGS
jgi:hypothetical protein